MKKLFLLLIISATSLISNAKDKERTTSISKTFTHHIIFEKINPSLIEVSKTNYSKKNTLLASINPKKKLIATTKKKVALTAGPAQDNCRQAYNQTIRMLREAIYSDSNQENPADEWIINLIALEQYQECMRESIGLN